MKLLKTLSIALIALLIAVPCAAMEIDDEPEYDISKIDTTRTDQEYLRQVYYNAPENIKTLIEMDRPYSTKRLSLIYHNEHFVWALLKTYRALLHETLQEYPELQYRIGKITNQTLQKLKLRLNEQAPGTFRQLETFLNPNETKNINFIPVKFSSKYQPAINISLSAYSDFFHTSRGSFDINIRPTENREVSVMLYSNYTGKTIDKTTFRLNPLNNIYDINIVLKGDNLVESTVSISLPHTSLIKAVKNLDHAEVRKEVTELASRGLDILGQDEEGNTPLHYAALNDWSDPRTEQIFGYLLSVNPQLLTIANNEGESPLSLVPIEIREKIQDLIEGKYAEKPDKEE